MFRKIFGLITFFTISLILCFLYYQTNREKSIVIASAISSKTIDFAEIPMCTTTVPKDRWANQILYGSDGEIAIVGYATILISLDKGKNWETLEGGLGKSQMSVDGGISYSDYKNEENVISTKKLCSPESGILDSKSGRLFLKTTCEHSHQIWSISIRNKNEQWFVKHFLPNKEGREGVYGPDTKLVTDGNKIYIRSITPKGVFIVSTEDNGMSWHPIWQQSSFETPISNISFASQNKGWALKKDGSILQTNDSGKTWSVLSVLPKDLADRAHSITFSKNQVGYIVGKKGLILVTHDGGKQWLDQSKYSEIDWYNIVVDGAKGAWITGNSKLILNTSDGKTWSVVEVPDYVYTRLSVSNGKAWFVHGRKIYRFPCSENVE